MVKVKSGEIFRFFTVDMDLDQLQIEKEEECMFKDDGADKYERLKREKKKAKQLYIDVTEHGKDSCFRDFCNTDKDFKKCRSVFPNDFFKYYNKGANEYLLGNWKDAKISFELALKTLKDVNPKTTDIPSQRLLDYINSLNLEPPLNWEGYKDEDDD